MTSEKNNKFGRLDIDLTPIRELGRQMDSFFNQSFKHMNSIFDLRPFWVEVNESDSNFIVTAELPGYKREHIRVEVLGHYLRISVEDIDEMEKVDERKQFYSHRHVNQIKERTVNLPFEIPEKEMKASFNNGLLKLIIPKVNSQRKFIDIEADD